LDSSVLQIKTKNVSVHTANTKLVKQEVNGIVILPPLVFPAQTIRSSFNWGTVVIFLKIVFFAILKKISKTHTFLKNCEEPIQLNVLPVRAVS